MDLYAQTGDFDQEGNQLKNACDSAAQDSIDTIIKNVRDVRSVALTIINITQPIVTKFKDAKSNINSYPVQMYVQAFAYVSIALVAVACVFGVFGALLRSPCLLTVAAFIGVLMLFLILGLMLVELTVNLALADFCAVDPLNETVAILNQTLSSTTSIQQGAVRNIQFFLTCEGTNPLASSIESVSFLTHVLGELRHLCGAIAHRAAM